MEPEQRTMLDGLWREAHDKASLDGDLVAADAAAIFVRKVRELEPYGQQWVGDYIHDLIVAGAKRDGASWRRKASVSVQTKSGPVDLPRFAGIRVGGIWRQVELGELSLEELDAHARKLSRQRNTLSRELAALSRLREVMQVGSLSTVGEALDQLEAA